MRKLFYIAGLVLSCRASILAQNTVTITVGEFENTKGVAFVGLYNRAEAFGKPAQVFKGKEIPVRGKFAECVFDNLPDGTYAVAVFQDENGNQTLDTGLFGIPKENYGFSNNIKPKMRQATFDEAKFVLKGQPLAMTVKIN